MNVIVEKHGSSVYVLESNTNLVLCTLPGILEHENIGSVFKALSIMLKELSVASAKWNYRKRKAVKQD